MILPGIIPALLSIAVRYKALWQTPHANGLDGYLYLHQFKNWMEGGILYANDYSLFYPFLKVVYWFTGDYVSALKLSAALLTGGVTFALFMLSRRWSGSIYLAVLLGSISLFSPQLTYLAVQHPKHLLGIFFLLLFLLVLSSKRSWIPALFLGLNFFGHQLTFGLTLIFGGLMLVFKKMDLKTAGFFVFSAFLLLTVSQFLPGWPAISDLERFQHSFSKMPQFAPWSFIVDFGQNDKISSLWLGEIILSTAIYFLSIPFLLRVGRKAVSWSFFVICTLLLFPFFNWSLTGIAYRFLMLFILLSPLFLSLLISKNETYRQRFILLGCSVVLMVGSTFSYQSYIPEKHDLDVIRYEELTEKSKAILQDHPVHLVIAHKGLAEYFACTTGVDAVPWIPETVEEKDLLWRIATDIRASELERHLTAADLEYVSRLNVKYYLLPEYLWQKIIRGAETEENMYLLEKIDTWRNPKAIRAGFSIKKR